MRYLRVLAVMAVVLFGFGSAPVMSDTYPSRAVTIVVPYPAGGSVDGVARMIAQKLTEALGQSSSLKTARVASAASSVRATWPEPIPTGIP